MIFRPLNYAVAFVGFTALVAVIAYLIERYAGYSLGNGGTSVAVPLVCAMMEGQQYVRRAKAAPEKRAMWGAAARMTGIASVISVVIFGLLILVDPSLTEMFGILSVTAWMAICAIVLMLVLLVSRFGYGMGVRSQLKAQAHAGD
jgi:hypothetical protein